MRPDRIEIRALEGRDHDAVARFVAEHWGAAVVVAHGTVFHPATLPGFAAWLVPVPVGASPRRSADQAAVMVESGAAPETSAPAVLHGLLTYEVRAGTMEIVTLDAVRPQSGIGTALVEAAAGAAAALGCGEIRLTTTNDNLNALRFYQRRGFRLDALRPGGVARARALKPEIPLTGEHGIPLRDELDLVRPV